MIQDFLFCFAVLELLKILGGFFVIQDCSFFFSIFLLYNTKIYIKMYPTRFLNCKKELKKVYHIMFKEFPCSQCLFFLMLFIKGEF